MEMPVKDDDRLRYTEGITESLRDEMQDIGFLS